MGSIATEELSNVGIKHLNVALAFITEHICVLEISRILLIWRNIIISLTS